MMKNTPKGLLENDFQDALDKSDEVQIDSSSHSIRSLCLKEYPKKKFLRKTYASPDLLKKTSSSQHSYLGSLLSYIFPQIWGNNVKSESEASREEQRHLELSGQLEAFYSGLYRILLQEKAAETYSIHDDNGRCTGTVSKLIPGFISAKKKPIIIGNHIPDLAEMLTASHIFQEDDLHKGNYGVDENNRIVRLDFDMSGWSLTCEVKGARAISAGNIALRNPKDRFPLEEVDIENLPVLTEAQPFYWPTSFFYYFNDSQDFANLKDDLIFNRHKYLTYLQFCLIPDSYFETLGVLYIQDKYKQERDEHVALLIDRRNRLRKLLLEMPAFQCFILNKGIFKISDDASLPLNSVLNKFQKYNQYIRGTMQFNPREILDTTNIKSQFEDMQRSADIKFNRETVEFRLKNYIPFKIPEHDVRKYIKRKEVVKEKLRTRLDYLKQVVEQSNCTLGLLVNPSTAIDGLYNKFIRGQNIKDIKIKWLEEVLRNAEDENKVIMEWFQTKDTPFYPIIQTGETGRLIDAIREDESRYAVKLIKLNQHHGGDVQLDEDPDVVLDDDFMDSVLEQDAKQKTQEYIFKIKKVLSEKVQALVSEYAKGGYFFNPTANRKQIKHDYWLRVRKDIDKASALSDIFEAIRFTPQEQISSADIMAGTQTQQLYSHISELNSTFPQDIRTERNHAVKWLNRFIKSHYDEKSINQPKSSYGLWYDDRTKREFQILVRALKNLKDTSKPIEDAVSIISNSNIQTSHPELKAFIDHFQATTAIRFHNTVGRVKNNFEYSL